MPFFFHNASIHVYIALQNSVYFAAHFFFVSSPSFFAKEEELSSLSHTNSICAHRDWQRTNSKLGLGIKQDGRDNFLPKVHQEKTTLVINVDNEKPEITSSDLDGDCDGKLDGRFLVP